MSESTKCMNIDMEDNTESAKKYCFGCLCDDREKQIKNYTFVCGPLREIFQMPSIYLCYLCKRIAQHTEQFIQNVQSNQILLENFYDVMDDTLKSVRLQTQPLVNLKPLLLDMLELPDKEGNSSEEVFSVVCSRKDDVKVKIEMKEEELLDNLEAEFINGDDEFPEMYVKEEDDYPLNELKEEIEADNIDNVDISRTIKKKLKKKDRIKSEVSKKSLSGDVPKIKLIYITRKQCMEERVKLAEDQKYKDSGYKCTDCIKGFCFKGSYDKHMEKHSRCMGDYQCDICKQRMDSGDKLAQHMRYHLIRYKCIECGLVRNSRMTIKDHYSAYHAQDQHFSCPHCVKIYRRQVSLRKHISYAHGTESRVQCAYCSRTYANKFVLKQHMMLKHTKEISAVEVCKRCVCPVCGMGFKTPSQLRSHSIKHSDRRDHYCVECDKSFKSEHILKTHLRTAAIHVNYKELPLPCLHCEKRFSNRRDVERHTNRVHLNVRPYTCDKCDKAYVNAWALKDHKRYIHEGYKRPLQYPCPMCDKVFDRNQILKSHIRTHTGERPYQCSKCPAQFSQASVLRTHDRLIHLKLTRDGRPKNVAMK
ncbi:uncharacterized protein LOC142983973 isoform X2 [Anticarsia gemmatalis]|uniref:uncharacterized protein LOC142983973 isoform X2 n=1 Tax=Anticarsia gemmatalis TaxID=129554 RepID=UPI003F7604A2